MALIVALLAWRWPARTIRAQVLTLRERAWVQVAHMSGVGGLRIIFFELMPNLLPYLAASLVGAIASAILASIGLEALGLGPIDSPTLGMTIYWVIYYAALLHGYWWWWLPPIAIITILFVGLFNLAGGWTKSPIEARKSVTRSLAVVGHPPGRARARCAPLLRPPLRPSWQVLRRAWPSDDQKLVTCGMNGASAGRWWAGAADGHSRPASGRCS